MLVSKKSPWFESLKRCVTHVEAIERAVSSIIFIDSELEREGHAKLGLHSKVPNVGDVLVTSIAIAGMAAVIRVTARRRGARRMGTTLSK